MHSQPSRGVLIQSWAGGGAVIVNIRVTFVWSNRRQEGCGGLFSFVFNHKNPLGGGFRLEVAESMGKNSVVYVGRAKLAMGK